MFTLKSVHILPRVHLKAVTLSKHISCAILLASVDSVHSDILSLNGPFQSSNYSFSYDRAADITLIKLLQAKLEGNGYFIELYLKGIGFKVFRFGEWLFLQLGFSHFYVYRILPSLILKAKRDRIVIFGINKALVGSTAYDLYSLRRPDAYKAKGVQYKNSVYRLKEGKKK